jgi:O-antigen ligase
MRAVVYVSIIGSGISFILFFLNDGNASGWVQKDYTGSQRYGFVYLIAFYLLHLGSIQFKSTTLHFSVKGLIILGIFLTFSRAAIVTFIICSVYYEFTQKKISSINHYKQQRSYFTYLFGAALVVLIIPVTTEYYQERILNYLIFGDPSNYMQANTSEGIRFGIWERAFTFTSMNPLGNGFLGIWSIEEVAGPEPERAGSAHNQYIDVLFRSGFIGIILYTTILYKVFKSIQGKYIGLQAGLVSTIIYGIFHETFKESQGAFILALLIGIYANRKTYYRFF